MAGKGERLSFDVPFWTTVEDHKTIRVIRQFRGVKTKHAHIKISEEPFLSTVGAAESTPVEHWKMIATMRTAANLL